MLYHQSYLFLNVNIIMGKEYNIIANILVELYEYYYLETCKADSHF